MTGLGQSPRGWGPTLTNTCSCSPPARCPPGQVQLPFTDKETAQSHRLLGSKGSCKARLTSTPRSGLCSPVGPELPPWGRRAELTFPAGYFQSQGAKSTQGGLVPGSEGSPASRRVLLGGQIGLRAVRREASSWLCSSRSQGPTGSQEYVVCLSL